MCGVPLVASSFGAFHETVVEGVTGYRCHTLADGAAAIALSATLDRARIAEVARSRYSPDVVGRQYDWALRQLADLSGRGWYGEVSRKFAPLATAAPTGEVPTWQIGLHMLYFGAVPHCFQLHPDSPDRADSRLRVFLMIDIDLLAYWLSDNRVVASTTFEALWTKAIRFVERISGLNALPNGSLPTHVSGATSKLCIPRCLRHWRRAWRRGGDLVGWYGCDFIYER